MRSFTPAIMASLSGRSGAGRAVVITRRDGTVLRLVEAMTTKTIGDQTFVPGTGLIVGSIAVAANEQATSVDLDVVAVAGGVISPADVRAGIYRGASVDIYLINRLSESDGLNLLFSGAVGQVTERGLGRITIEALGPLGRAAQEAAHKFSPTCRWLFGDGFCGIALEPLKGTATVASGSGYTLTITGGSAAADYWNNGHISVTSGLLKGFDFEIMAWDGAGTLKLFLPVAGLITAGTTLDLYPGCTYQIDGAGSCSTRWSNAVNFGGEPWMPGFDRGTSLVPNGNLSNNDSGGASEMVTTSVGADESNLMLSNGLIWVMPMALPADPLSSGRSPVVSAMQFRIGAADYPKSSDLPTPVGAKIRGSIYEKADSGDGSTGGTLGAFVGVTEEYTYTGAETTSQLVSVAMASPVTLTAGTTYYVGYEVHAGDTDATNAFWVRAKSSTDNFTLYTGNGDPSSYSTPGNWNGWELSEWGPNSLYYFYPDPAVPEENRTPEGHMYAGISYTWETA